MPRLPGLDRDALRTSRRPSAAGARRRLSPRSRALGHAARVPGPSEWDENFPSERLLPVLEVTLADLGVDLSAQRNIELDIEQREKKSPRPFCAGIEIPDRVVLVIHPKGGLDDWRALFHEAGHAEHFANTARGLPFEEKRLGDRAVTEGWACG